MEAQLQSGNKSNCINWVVVGHLLGQKQHMKKRLQFILCLIITTSCVGQKPDREAIENSVLKFYTWYIGTTKDLRYSKYVHPTIGENEMAKLDTKLYFQKIDSLGVMDKEFIQSEKERFRPCDEFLRTVKWLDYLNSDELQYEEKCSFLNYYYWTWGQEPHDGVEVLKVKINKDKAVALTSIFFEGNKQNGGKTNVHLIKRGDKWLIRRIDY